MKRIIFLLILFSSFFTYSQWTFRTDNDPFDGQELIAIGRGYGGDFPYQNPRIVFRQNLKEKELDVYIDGAGYSGCDSNNIDFSFGNAEEVLSFYGKESVNRDAVFLDFSMKDNSFLKLNTLIKNLKSKSIVYVEVSNRCMRNRFNIRLSGSNAALNKAIGNFMDEGVKELEEIEREVERRIKEREEQERLKKEREAEQEKRRKEAEERKKQEDANLKRIKIDALFRGIDGITIKPSVAAMDEIMEEQVVNYTRPPRIGVKTNHSMLDIDKISLNPTSLSCVFNIVVYDYDLPKPRQAFLSNKKVTLSEEACDEFNKKLNNNAIVYEVLRIDDERIKRGEGEIIVTDSSIEFMLPESSSIIPSNFGKQYFSAFHDSYYFDVYYLPTSKVIKTNSVSISRGKKDMRIIYEIETVQPYRNKKFIYSVREKKK